MDVRTVGELPKEKNPHGVDVKKLYDTENAVVVHITLQPGEGLKRHITPVDVAFYGSKGAASSRSARSDRSAAPTPSSRARPASLTGGRTRATPLSGCW